MTSAGGPTRPDTSSGRARRAGSWPGASPDGASLVGDALVGLLPAGAMAVASQALHAPDRYRPAALLVFGVIAVGLLRNSRAATFAATSTLLLVWWAFTPELESFAIAGTGEAAGLGLLAGAVAGVLLLLHRVEDARRRVVDEARVVDALVEQTPIGIGLLDRELRFRRINPQLAEMAGSDPAEHAGATPSEIDPTMGARAEALMRRVLETGIPIHDQVLSVDVPRTGLERHWRVDLYPIRAAGDEIAGLGTTVGDITEDVVLRRRSALLLRLSRAIAGASTRQEVADSIAAILSEELRGRVTVIEASGDALEVQATGGYDDAGDKERWSRLSTVDPASTLVGRAIASGTLTLTAIEDAPDTAAEHDAELALRRRAGDVTVAWQPVARTGATEATAAIGIAWPYRRVVTEHSRTLLQTVASITGLALSRIDLGERAAEDRFRTAMDAMIDQVLLCRSVRDDAGRIVDFEVEYANATALTSTGREEADIVGHRVCDLYPRWRSSGMFDRFRQVVETGEPLIAERTPYQDEATDGRRAAGYWNIQVVKVEDGYIAASRDVTALVEAERVADEARATAQRERIAVDLLQRAALPAVLPSQGALELGAHYRPAGDDRPVGGDWYDAFPLDDRTVGLVIADVAGHGQEAAAHMLQVRNIFRAVASERRHPDAVLAQVDRVLSLVALDRGPFVTCAYATLDTRTGELTWALAGHLAPIVATEDGGTVVGEVAPGPPLATWATQSYETCTATLGPGDAVVLYTDGLVERRGEVLDVGIERLRAAVERRGSTGPADLARALAEETSHPTDDIAVLVARMRPRP